MKTSASLCLLFSLLPLLSLAAPPTATNDTRSVPKNTPVTIDVLDNDVDPDGDRLSLLTESVSQPENGTVTVNEDGGIRYVPNLNFIGTDRFTYTVIDDSEGQESASAAVIVTVVDTSLSLSPSSINDRGVSEALNSICEFLGQVDTTNLTGGYSALAANCENLLALFTNNPEAALRAVQQIAPEETLALLEIGGSASALQSRIIDKRMNQLAAGSTDVSGNALAWSKQLAGGAAGDTIPWSRIGVFGSVQLEGAEKKRNLYEAGFDFRSRGMTFGADYLISNRWFAGAALGWTKNTMDYALGGGEVDSDVYTFLAYSTYNLNNFSFDLQVGSGSSSIDISRTISYGLPGATFDATATGRTNGSQSFIKLQTQYMWNHNALSLYPSLRYNIANSKVDDYAENNAGGWEVAIGEQNTRQQTIEVGLQGTYALNQTWGVLVPTVDLNVISDLDTDQEILYAEFGYAPPGSAGFAMYGEPPESLFYMAGMGVSALLPNGGSGFININKTFSYNGYSAVQLQFGFRLEY